MSETLRYMSPEEKVAFFDAGRFFIEVAEALTKNSKPDLHGNLTHSRSVFNTRLEAYTDFNVQVPASPERASTVVDRNLLEVCGVSLTDEPWAHRRRATVVWGDELWIATSGLYVPSEMVVVHDVVGARNERLPSISEIRETGVLIANGIEYVV